MDSSTSFTLPSHLIEALRKQQNDRKEQQNNSSTTTPEDYEDWEKWDTEDIVLPTKADAESTDVLWRHGSNIIDDEGGDRPLIIIDLTRFASEYDRTNAVTVSTEAQYQELLSSVDNMLSSTDDFTNLTDELFERRLAFHVSSSVTIDSVLGSLQHAYTSSVFGVIEYPTTIDNFEVSELLSILRWPSRHKSVSWIKEALCQTSRDLVWKAQVATEIQDLAEAEAQYYESSQQDLVIRIEQLERLRSSFKNRLENDKIHIDTKAAILKHLVKIEEELVSAINTLESLIKFGFPEEQQQQQQQPEDEDDIVPPKTNLLDTVIQMIFDRLPVSPKLLSGRRCSASLFDDPYETFRSYHGQIRKLWKEDFGRLPQRYVLSEAPSYYQEERTGMIPPPAIEQQQQYVVEDDSEDEQVDSSFACVSGLEALSLSFDYH